MLEEKKTRKEEEGKKLNNQHTHNKAVCTTLQC